VHNDFFLCVLQNAHSDELPPKPSKKKAVASGEGKETKTNKDGSKKKDAAAKDKDKEGKKEAKEKKASASKKKGAIDGEEEEHAGKKTKSAKKGAKAATDAGQWRARANTRTKSKTCTRVEFCLSLSVKLDLLNRVLRI